MKLDILIKNGHVLDTYTNTDCVKDIGIINNRVVSIDGENIECDNIINAEGCYVFPGFIDFHCHVYYGGSGWAINPEWLLPTGVTSVVDPGSSGCANYEAFRKSVISNTNMHIKSYISVFSGGLIDIKIHQDYNPDLFNVKSIKRLKDIYKDDILGLKIMLSKNIIYQNNALDILKKTVDLAENIGGLSVCVHTTNPAIGTEEISDILRADDIYCHCYQGTGESIINDNGRVRKNIKKARQRGVVFDAANGGAHYCNEVVNAAIADGFLPDIMSSDLTVTTFNKSNKLRNFPFILSRYLSLGIDLKNIIKAVTETPARHMKMEGQIGTIKPGAFADIAIFKIKDGKVRHLDFKNDIFEGKYLMVPQMTILGGEIVFSQVDFNI